ncbi:hypothetical protein [Shinella sp. DD12]|uniref:hypothetical protein n=1 Tax=Shinella sp. DD12 TaxID=1410620 RepID=UPI0003C53E30|nr:hypothetical protein [Shinella sp. DD12]EYR80000.1 hypothetical protein SHLA_1c001800 [Shinella sp. DD12]
MAQIIKDPRYPNAPSVPEPMGESNDERIRRTAMAARTAQPLPDLTTDTPEPTDPGLPTTAGSAELDGILERFRSIHPRPPGRPRKGEGVADLALAFASADRLDERATKIAAELDAAEAKLHELEANKAEIDVLDPAAMDAYLADTVKTKAAIDMLRPALTRAQAEAEKARADENDRAFEERVRATLSKIAPLYAQTLQAMVHHANVIGGLGFEMNDLTLSITGLAEEAKARGRFDLLLPLDTLRSAAVAGLRTDAKNLPPEPVRLGESDAQWEARVWATVEAQAARYKAPANSGKRPIKGPGFWAKQMHARRNDGEGDEAYAGRRLVFAAMALDIFPTEHEDDADFRARVMHVIADKLKLTRKGETDRAWNLRYASWASRRDGPLAASDPALEAGARAIPAINVHFATEAMRETARKQRRDRLQEQLDDRMTGHAANAEHQRAQRSATTPLGLGR